LHAHSPLYLQASTVAKEEHEQKSKSSSKRIAINGHDETSALLMR
jgi:hypothetical protein